MKNGLNKLQEIQLLPLLPVAALPVLLFGRFLFFREAFYWGIPALQFIPWRASAWDQIQHGILPLWNSLSGMGAPLAANYQLALFYPPSWILYLFAWAGGTAWIAWAHQFVLILHLIWAGLGMVCLMRMIGVGRLSQTIAGITFPLGGYVAARLGFYSMVWTAAWMPWILYFASHIAAPFRNTPAPFTRKTSILLSISITMLLLAGHAQLSWYIFIFLGLWVFYGGFVQGGFRDAFKASVRLVIPILIGVGLAAIQLIPTAENLLQSQRSAAVDYEAMMAYSYWPWRLITLLAPDFFGNPGNGNFWGYASYWEDALYIGVLPFLLCLSTFRQLFRKGMEETLQNRVRPLLRFLWLVTVLSFIIAMGKFTPVFPLLARYVPTFRMFHAPARFLIWAAFSFSLLAGVGVEFWKTPTGKGLYWLRLGTAGGAAVTIGAFLAWYFLKEVNPTFIRATALAGLWGVGTGLLTLFMPKSGGLKKSINIWQGLVVIWAGADLLILGWTLNPGVPIDFYRPETPIDLIQSRLGDHRIFLGSVTEYRLKFDRFLRFADYRPIENVLNMRAIELPDLNVIDNIPSANNFDALLPWRYSNWIDQIDRLPRDQQQNWLALMDVGLKEEIDVNTPLGVRFDPVPGAQRVRWYGCSKAASSDEEALQLIGSQLNSGSGQPEKRLIVQGPVIRDLEKCPVPNPGMILKIEDQPGRVKITMDSEVDGWIFLADTWYPGWVVSVDQRDESLYRANYLFMATRVPAGKHTIVFSYRASIYWIGFAFSAAAWLFVITSIIISSGFVSYGKMIREAKSPILRKSGEANGFTNR